MATTNLQLTPEQRQVLAAHPEQQVDTSRTRKLGKTCLLLEKGKFPELEEEYIRVRFEEGFAASERGEEEDWDDQSIKAEGRRIRQHRESRA